MSETEAELAKQKLATEDAESRRDELEAECARLRSELEKEMDTGNHISNAHEKACKERDASKAREQKANAEICTLTEAAKLKDAVIEDMRARITKLEANATLEDMKMTEAVQTIEARNTKIAELESAIEVYAGAATDDALRMQNDLDAARSELTAAAEHAEALQAKLEEYKDARAAQATQPGPTPDAEITRRLAASEATRQGLEAFRDIVERHRRAMPVAVRDALDGLCG